MTKSEVERTYLQFVHKLAQNLAAALAPMGGKKNILRIPPKQSRRAFVLKGRGFSRAVSHANPIAALAAEVNFGQPNRLSHVRSIWNRSLVIALIVCLCALSSIAQTPAAKPGVFPAAQHDGQHDFDFLFGRWKVHCRRLLHPLTASNDWIEFDGTNVVHKVWDGRANMDEFEADTPSGHTEGMTIRTYSSQSHQWTIYWSAQKNGTVDFPPMVGEFTNGRGEFFDAETYNGRSIFVRFTWTASSPNSCHWEQAFSADGGKTWETNFIWDLTRAKGITAAGTAY